MSTPVAPTPSQIERIERALVLLALFVELDGDVHVPMYAKFEAELAELKATEDARARARQRLAAYRSFADPTESIRSDTPPHGLVSQVVRMPELSKRPPACEA